MHDDAVLGGPGARFIKPQVRQELHTSVQAITTAKHRDWSLPAAMVDSQMTVYRYTRSGTGETRYFTSDEHAEQTVPDEWQRGEAIQISKGVDGRQAVQFGLAHSTVSDYDELLQLYQLEDAPEPVEANRAITAIERLASQPWFARTLLFIAFFALLSEASAPGVGVAGFISGLCFLLFFWSQFLNGTADWLEVLLFVGGLTFVLLEIFVIPGLGVFGVGGGVMIIVSIVLASQTFVIPRNSYQLEQLPSSLLMVVLAFGGGLAALLIVPRFLPRTPYVSRMMLAPPEGEQRDELSQRESLVNWVHLQGKRGVTTTRLSPSGKARFGDDLVDVISDGELIPAGTDICVVEVHGNHILVRAIDEDPAWT
jgi:membrane-bound ClpP family serine protease